MERKVQLSVTCFLYHKQDYLFLKRAETKRTDPGRLNGVGGKVEPGENYLDAAIREVQEETGYKVKEEDIKLTSIVRLEDGYHVDWMMCFFKIKVDSKEIPIGTKTEDGELMWIHQDDVLDTKFKLVDDIYYLFDDMRDEEFITFMSARLNDDQKVVDSQISKLKQ